MAGIASLKKGRWKKVGLTSIQSAILSAAGKNGAIR